MGRAAPLRRIVSLGRPYTGRLGAALVVSAGSVAASLAVPLGLSRLLDAVVRDGTAAALDRIALALLALFVGKAALSFAGGYLLKSTGERIVADLRVRLYAHLHTLGFGFFAGQRTGDLTSRLNSDVLAVRTAVTDAVVSCVLQLFTFAGAVAVMLSLNARLCLMVLAVVPLVTLVSRAFGGTMSRLAREMQERLGESTAVAEQALSAIRVVQAFARGPFEVARYGAAAERVFEASRRRTLGGALLMSAVDLLFTAVVVAIFWYGGREMLAGRLSPGALVAFLFYALSLSQSVGELSQVYGALTSAAGASGRIFELLDTPPEVADAPDAAVLPPARGALALEEVDFGYEAGRTVLRGVSLEVRPGETVALVGPSGAGKTTLLGLVPRFFDPQRGRVLVDGHDVRRLRLASLREQVAVVTQEVHLFPASVAENIRYGRLDATDAEVVAAARAANAHAFIMALPGGYAAEVGERGVRLSAGQRQRISIARALLRDAPILLLDEATSALDAESEALVHEALERLVRGRTTLIVAHRLSTVRGADRILVVDEGRIAEAGTHDELVGRGGLYARLSALSLGEGAPAGAAPAEAAA